MVPEGRFSEAEVDGPALPGEETTEARDTLWSAFWEAQRRTPLAEEGRRWVREHDALSRQQSSLSRSWRPSVLEVFSGSGGLSAAFHLRGCATLQVDLVTGWDLRRGRDMKILRRLIDEKRFDDVHLAPPCSSFSVAVTPPIRTAACVRGVPWASARSREKLADGNA